MLPQKDTGEAGVHKKATDWVVGHLGLAYVNTHGVPNARDPSNKDTYCIAARTTGDNLDYFPVNSDHADKCTWVVLVEMDDQGEVVAACKLSWDDVRTMAAEGVETGRFRLDVGPISRARNAATLKKRFIFP